jgi:hypothetical protein
MITFLLLFATMMQTAASPAALKGTVTRGSTTEPVAHARILIVASDSANVRPTLTSTDERGGFVVRSLPPAAYRIIADHEGFVRTSAVVTVIESKTTTIDVAMTASGVITGRVTDAHGEPVARAFVRATNGKQTYDAPTNDLGEYRIFDLPPGAYVVSGAPYPAPRIQGSVLIRPTPPSPYSPGEGQAMLFLTRMLQAGDYIDPMALTREVYLPVFYPGTTEEASAAPVDVAPGATVAGIDLTVVRGPAPAQ